MFSKAMRFRMGPDCFEKSGRDAAGIRSAVSLLSTGLNMKRRSLWD